MKVTREVLEFEDGQLVKIGGMRPEYMDGHRLIKAVRDIAALLLSVEGGGPALPKATVKQEAGGRCDICREPIYPNDICSMDVEMGACHAACLEGSPVVDLETGEPVDGPAHTFRYEECEPNGGWPYQKTFDAISAATSITGGGKVEHGGAAIAISVTKLAEAFGPMPVLSSVPVGWKMMPPAPTDEMKNAVRNIAGAQALAFGLAAYGTFFATAPAPQPPAEGGWMPSQAVNDVLAERRRQIEAEGWSVEHDDAHEDYSLAKAGCIYAVGATMNGPDRAVMDEFGASGTPAWMKELWPWDIKWWKPSSRRRDLVKAAALIVAEIERLDRLPLAPANGGHQ